MEAAEPELETFAAGDDGNIGDIGDIGKDLVTAALHSDSWQASSHRLSPTPSTDSDDDDRGDRPSSPRMASMETSLTTMARFSLGPEDDNIQSSEFVTFGDGWWPGIDEGSLVLSPPPTKPTTTSVTTITKNTTTIATTTAANKTIPSITTPAPVTTGVEELRTSIDMSAHLVVLAPNVLLDVAQDNDDGDEEPHKKSSRWTRWLARAHTLRRNSHTDNRTRVVVIGVDTAAGESVARHLLQDEQFHVVIAIPSPSSLTTYHQSHIVDLSFSPHLTPALDDLRDMGATIRVVDFMDPHALARVLRGAAGVYYGEGYNMADPQPEIERGCMLAQMAKYVGIPHLIYASLEHVRKMRFKDLPRLTTPSGTWVVPHWDAKGTVEDYMRTLKLPATYLRMPILYHELLDGALMTMLPEGNHCQVSMPLESSTMVCAMAAGDVGGCVRAMLLEPSGYIGRTVGLAGSKLPVAVYVKLLSQHVALPLKYSHMTREEYIRLAPNLTSTAFANMFDFMRHHPSCWRRSVEETRTIHPDTQSFADWCASDDSHVTAVLNDNNANTRSKRSTSGKSGVLAAPHLQRVLTRKTATVHASGNLAHYADMLALSGCDHRHKRQYTRRWRELRAVVGEHFLAKAAFPRPTDDPEFSDEWPLKDQDGERLQA